MAGDAKRKTIVALLLGATALLLTGCIISAPGTYPDPKGPRDAKGFLVDPQTGIELPGTGCDGI
jgi:hypothetical protein